MEKLKAVGPSGSGKHNKQCTGGHSFFNIAGG